MVYYNNRNKERTAERLEGGKYEIIFSNQKRRTEKRVYKCSH